jgi:hypothetical protein
MSYPSSDTSIPFKLITSRIYRVTDNPTCRSIAERVKYIDLLTKKRKSKYKRVCYHPDIQKAILLAATKT